MPRYLINKQPKHRCSYFQRKERKESKNKAVSGGGSCVVTKVIFLPPPPSLLLFTLFSLLLISFSVVIEGNILPTPNRRAGKAVIDGFLLIQYPPSLDHQGEWDRGAIFTPIQLLKCFSGACKWGRRPRNNIERQETQ